MSSKKRRWSGPVTITLWFISLIIWILYAAMYREPYCTYRFPVVDMTFFRITLVNLFVPSIPVIICGIFSFSKKMPVRLWSAILSIIILIPLVACFVVRGASEILYSPTIWSETTDVANFGKIDERMTIRVESLPREIFPQEIPETANNVQYYYYYAYSATDDFYMAVSWECNRQEFDNTMDNMVQYNKWTTNEIGEYILRCDDPLDDIYLYVSIIWDPNLERIYYIAVSQEETLPDTSQEVLFSEYKTGDDFAP